MPSTRVLLAPMLACAASTVVASEDPGRDSIRAAALKGHIAFLASDEMAGRDSLSPEGRIAAEYIAGLPLESTVAVLNMDMIGRDEESPTWGTRASDNRNSVNLVGTLYNPDLRRVIEAENRSIGLTLDYKTDGDDPEGWFSRSDHYPFAVHGVPMVLFNTGEHPDYHTANDTRDRINYPKMEKIIRLVYASAKSLANGDGRPSFVTETPMVTTAPSRY